MSILDNRRFTFFDVETPNGRNDSICSIAFLTISENGNIDEKYYLINPEAHFEERNIAIHKITPLMVEGMPTFKEVWKEIEPYFTNAIVVAHNANFDLNVLNKCFDKYDIDKPKLFYLCTLRLAQKYLNLESNRLNCICDEFGISLENHHSADCDTQACYEIFLRINEIHPLDDSEIREFIPSNTKPKTNKTVLNNALNSLYGIIKGIYFDEKFNEKEVLALQYWLNEYKEYKLVNDISSIYKKVEISLQDNYFSYDEYNELVDVVNQNQEISYLSSTTLSMQVLMGIIRGITADKVIDLLEIIRLREWMEKNTHLKGNFPFDKICQLVESVLEDGVIDSNEYQDLIKIFEEFLNPKTDSSDGINFENNFFCLTGTFKFGTKADVERKIVENGGLISNTVTNKVSYLIVGGEGSENYAFGNYGTKVNKAMKMQESGHDIAIISEKKLLEEITGDIKVIKTFDFSIDEFNNLLKDIIKRSGSVEHELETQPLGSKDKDFVKGYSFKAYKNVWFRITLNMKSVIRVELNKVGTIYDELLKSFDDYSVTNDNFIKFEIDKNENALYSFINRINNHLMKSYIYLCENEPVDNFGCCSHYEECSNERKCIQTNYKFAKGCAYRKNLLNNRIFYGKNKTI